MYPTNPHPTPVGWGSSKVFAQVSVANSLILLLIKMGLTVLVLMALLGIVMICREGCGGFFERVLILLHMVAHLLVIFGVYVVAVVVSMYALCGNIHI